MRVNQLGMSIVISHPESGSIEEQITLFAQTGFDTLFLSCGVTEEFRRIPCWARLAREVGIRLEAVHAPSGLLGAAWQDPEAGEVLYKQLTGIVDHCASGEVEKVVTHVAIPTAGPVTTEGLALWRRIGAYAKAQGVHLCFENATPPEHLAAVMAQADPFHGFCYDVGHHSCYTPEEDYLTAYGDRLLYTHIHDNFGPSTDRHLLPYDGQVDWHAFMQALQAVGYTGTLNLELSCYYSEQYQKMSYSAFVKEAFERLKKLQSDV